jgi:multiple sugar transport system substrate-binding protein
MSACSDYLGHVGSGFTGSESAGADTVILSFGPEVSGTLVKEIDRFNKSNGNDITVRYREMPADSSLYFDKLRTEFQAGGGDIDVIIGDVIWPAQFAANGWIEDLGDRFTEDMRSEFLDAPVQASTYQGKVFGVPWYTDVGVLFYRKDLLSKAGGGVPKTWSDVRDITRKLVESGDARYGIVFQGAEYEGGVCDGCEYIWNAGGDVLDPADISRVVIGSSAAREGLSTERALVADGIAPESVAVYKEQESYTAFLAGDYVFARHWPYVFGFVSDPTISSLKPDQIDVAPLPVAQEGDESFSALGGWNFFINAASDKKEQAWEFIKFMSQDDIQGEVAINASFLPTKRAIYDDQKVLKEQPVVGLAKDVIPNAKPRPLHPFYSDMSLALSEGFNESLKGATSPSGAIDDIESKLNRIADVGAEVFDLGSSQASSS